MGSGCVRDRFNNVTSLTPRSVVKFVFLLGWAANFLNTPRIIELELRNKKQRVAYYETKPMLDKFKVLG